MLGGMAGAVEELQRWCAAEAAACMVVGGGGRQGSRLMAWGCEFVGGAQRDGVYVGPGAAAFMSGCSAVGGGGAVAGAAAHSRDGIGAPQQPGGAEAPAPAATASVVGLAVEGDVVAVDCAFGGHREGSSGVAGRAAVWIKGSEDDPKWYFPDLVGGALEAPSGRAVLVGCTAATTTAKGLVRGAQGGGGGGSGSRAPEPRPLAGGDVVGLGEGATLVAVP